METVWIAHPNLGDRKVEVPVSALPHHQRAGWEETDAPPPPPLPEPDPGPDDDPPDKTADQTDGAPADAGASSLPDESPRRRRTTTRGDE
ncbi:MAG: hypothetical protein JWO11_3734 [Nocardioides sp.]|nr:hypothetical protein [Nocardioides sp.]